MNLGVRRCHRVLNHTHAATGFAGRCLLAHH